MFPTNQSDSELLTRLLEQRYNDVPATLNTIAAVLARETSFFNDNAEEWEKVLLSIFRDQVSREKQRKTNNDKRRQIVKKRLEIVVLQRELQKHYAELQGLLSPSPSDDIEPAITNNTNDTVLEASELELQSSNMSTVVRSNRRKSSQIKVVRKYDPKTWHRVNSINKPKRPKNAYVFWMEENLKQIFKDNPHLTFSGVTKISGTIWNALTDKRLYIGRDMIHSNLNLSIECYR